jgi:non-ribosomal peptide synthetase component F
VPFDVVDRFLEQAGRTPNAPAVSAGGEALSYGALEQRIRRYAGCFAKVSEPRVLVALPPGFDAYACLFASGLAGGFHTPINVAAPLEKRRRIAALLEPDVIVCEPGAVADYADYSALLVTPDHVQEWAEYAGPGERHHLAYVIFTSGSTGNPKGVKISRAALAHYVNWLGTMNYGPGDRVSQQPNLAFDISMTDIFGALCYGATLFPLSGRADHLLPARFIQREQITVWNSTPSAISLMMQARQVTARRWPVCVSSTSAESLCSLSISTRSSRRVRTSSFRTPMVRPRRPFR